MIIIRHISQNFEDPPFLLFDHGEVIGEVSSFLRQLLLRGMANTTLRAYAYDLLSFYRFIDATNLNAPDLTRQRAMDYILMLKRTNAAPRTINRRITVARSFLNHINPGQGDEVFASPSKPFYKGQRNTALLGPSRIKRNGPVSLKVKVPSILQLPLQNNAVRCFVHKLRSYRDKAIVALMLCCGLRSCEVIDLQIHDIDLAAKQIRVWGKGNKERLIPISSWVASSVEQYMAFERLSVDHSTCFVVLKGHRRGQRMMPEGLRKIFRHRRKSSLLKNAHAHSFRHTFCTNLIRQKVPLPVVQRLMGHASIDTTLLYINLSLEDVTDEYHRAMDELRNAYEAK